jgi:oxygen-independent coproporphyrinogen-3 oxidase
MYIDKDLIKKYNKPGPRYTSYPPANHFTEEFTESDHVQMLKASNAQSPGKISLYIHIPFCPQICYFCGCNTRLMRGRRGLNQYLEALLQEIAMVAAVLDPTRRVSQIHWGGGTPNSLPLESIQMVMDKIREHFTLDEDPEIAMECSPAYLSLEDVIALSRMGFNRMSLGIQDMNVDLLRKLNRRPALYPYEDIYRTAKKAGFKGVNFDFVYGLPDQTLEDHLSSIQRAVDISPERIVTFSYAHVPWFKEHQKKLEVYHLPGADEKLNMLESSFNLLQQNGYVPIGMDHYAKPDDELSQALKNKTLHRNFQGYTTQEKTGQVYAFGATGISQLSAGYSQNVRSVDEYIRRIGQGHFPVFRGYRLNETEKIRRMVLNEIMCNHYLNFQQVADRMGVTSPEVKRLVEYRPEKLEEFVRDGLLTCDEEHVKVSSKGFFLIRNIAMSFDPMLTNRKDQYSKTI